MSERSTRLAEFCKLHEIAPQKKGKENTIAAPMASKTTIQIEIEFNRNEETGKLESKATFHRTPKVDSKDLTLTEWATWLGIPQKNEEARRAFLDVTEVAQEMERVVIELMHDLPRILNKGAPSGKRGRPFTYSALQVRAAEKLVGDKIMTEREVAKKLNTKKGTLKKRRQRGT